MGIEQIISRIVDEARVETTRIRSEYNEKVEALKKQWEEEKKMRLESLEHELEAITARETDRQVIAEKLEARKRLLAIKRELVDEAFKIAREDFLKLPKDKYLPILANVVSTSALTGNETVSLSKKDTKSLGKELVEKANKLRKERNEEGSLVLGDPVEDLAGGAVLKDKSVEIRRTIDDLILEVREDIEGKVLKALFEEQQ